ncbi:MAG: bifunctional methyltransferase/pyrophosphohydrolase YabN [Symbiobacteriia bacterium]
MADWRPADAGTSPLADILIVGLGPGAETALPAGTWVALESGLPVYLRTAHHPIVAALERAGLEYESFDKLYDTAPTFDAVYDGIVERLLTVAKESRLVYAVPGHPLVAEASVTRLLSRAAAAGLTAEVVAGASFLDALYTVLRLDPSQGLLVLDGLSLTPLDLPRGSQPLVVAQVYDRQVASDVKLTLMERYPDDFPVTVVRAAGVPGEERVEIVPLFELDRLDWVDHLTSLYVPPAGAASDTPADGDAEAGPAKGCRYPLDLLMEVVEQLRAPQGCPWDREQTHASLRPYVIEEAFEVAEALDWGDSHKLVDELGDLLLQIALHSVIAQEQGEFALADVVAGVTAKMIRRHPHVFGDVTVSGTHDVLRNWEVIKQQEKAEQGEDTQRSALAGVPPALPALMRAHKLQKKASRVGFDWPGFEGVWAKVKEEMGELEEAYTAGTREKIAAELGDVLFAVVNAARFLDVEPESALAGTTAKFIRRFSYVEAQAAHQGKHLQEMSLAEMDRLWDEAKQLETQGIEGGSR